MERNRADALVSRSSNGSSGSKAHRHSRTIVVATKISSVAVTLQAIDSLSEAREEILNKLHDGPVRKEQSLFEAGRTRHGILEKAQFKPPVLAKKCLDSFNFQPTAVIPINRVHSFLKAAECESFSAAARMLGVTPAAISKHIQVLESDFGTRLFHRSSRSLSLTEAGRGYYERVRDAFQILQDAERSLSQTGKPPSGTVRVTLPAGLGRAHVMPLISEFRQQHADISLELSFDDRQINLVQEAFDIGIGNTLSKDSQMVARPLLPLQRVVFGSPSYLSRAGIPKTLEDLARHECLCVRSASTGKLNNWEFQRDGNIVSVPVKGSLVLNEPLAACDAAVRGLGLTMVGTIQAAEYLAAGRLVALLTEYALQPRPVYIYYPHRRHLAPAVRAFVDFLTTRIQHLKVPIYGDASWRDA